MNTLRVYLKGLVSTVHQASRIIWATWRKSPRLEEVCWEVPRTWSGGLLRAARVEVRLEGLEHLEPGRPAVLVANHQSWFDVFALAAHLPVDYRFVGKKELASIPFFGPAWMSCGHIAIDRRDRSAAIRSLEVAGRTIREAGAVVIMFPEGTRSPDGRLLPFKKGAFMLALQLGVPVIPVGISGSRAVMPKGGWRVSPGTVTVRIGEPIPVEGMGVEGRDRLLSRAREAVEVLARPEGLNP